MSYYTEVNPPSVYADECPCANTTTGYSARCPEHGEIAALMAAGETALADTAQFVADIALIVDYELAVPR